MKTVAIIIRNVPESLRRQIKLEAARRGKSMAALMIEILDEGVRK